MAQFTMQGHCMCKTIEYTMDAPPIFTNCCHCRDCQSISGSCFALNSIVEASNVTITSAIKPTEKQELRPDRDPSSGKSFHCPNCGAMLWATSAKFGDGLVGVRVGTLMDNEKIKPDAHFFVRSKHPWIALPDGVPTYETLPGPDDLSVLSGEAKARFGAAMKKSTM